nr:MAG TPA: hypothetical protein [Siphoviridae sp. ctJbC4]
MELLIRFERTTCSLRGCQYFRFYNISSLKQKLPAPPLAPPPLRGRWRSFCVFTGRLPPVRLTSHSSAAAQTQRRPEWPPW